MQTTPEVISWADAKGRGLRHYFTGKPCGRGHIAPRFVSARKCIACGAHEGRADEGKSSRDRARREANPEREAEYTRQRYARHRAQWPAYCSKRRAARKQAVPAWFGELDQFVMIEAAELCRTRASATGINWEADHLIPLAARAACGLHCAANIQVIPAGLNRRKGVQLHLTEPREWLRAI